MSDKLTAFAPVHDAIASLQGYGLEHLSFSVVGTVDALELSLRPFNPKPCVTLSIRDIYYLAIHRLPGEEVDLFDFEATTLIPGEPWPRELPGSGWVSGGIPPLLWIRGNGPTTFDVVAGIVTVLSEVR